MSQSPKRQAVVVGLFTSVAIAILIGGILTIGDLNNTFTRKILVTTVFDEVSGLKEGDNVWFSGVKVGTVKKLTLQGESEVGVELAVEREAAAFLHADALAKISSDGLIGSRIVVLYGGTPEARAIADGDVLAAGDSVSTDDIMAVLQENNLNVKVITDRLARGEGTIGKLLKEDALYTELMATVGELKVASANATELTGSLATFSEKLNREGSLPNDLVTDRTTYATLTSAVGSLEHASEQASVLVEGLAQGAADPNSPVGVMMHDNAGAADLKVAMDNLSTSSALLVEDLTALQHNFLLRPYFKKQEKAEARAARGRAVPVAQDEQQP